MQKILNKFIAQLDTENESQYLNTLQQLTSFGDDYLDFIISEILKTGSRVDKLEQILIFMKPPRNTAKLCALTKNSNIDISIAAFKALSYSEDKTALPCLIDIFENSWNKKIAVEAMGNLKPFDFVIFLKKEVQKIIQDEPYQWIWDSQEPDSLSEDFDESDLILLLEIIKTLRKVGVNQHTKYLLLLKDYFHKDDYSDWFIIQLNTIRLLAEIPVPQVIDILLQKFDSNFLEMKEAVIQSLYLLGTPKALQALIEFYTNHENDIPDYTFWCLDLWTGQSFHTIQEYQSWWTKAKQSFKQNISYRYGEPISIENLIQHLDGKTKTLEFKLKELEIYTGLNFLPLLYREPNISLKEKALDLWKKKGFLFKIGRIYRFGELENSEKW